MANSFVEIWAATTSFTSTTQSSIEQNTDHRGLHLAINVTAVSGTDQQLTPTIQGMAPTAESGGQPSGQVPYTILSGVPITATGLTILKVYPGILPVPNGSANDLLPYEWRVEMAVSGTSPSFTASVFALLEA